MQQSCKQLSLHCLLNIFSSLSLALWIHHSLRPCLLCSSRLSPVHCRSCNSYITPHPFIILALGGEYWTVTYPHIDTIVEKAERLLDRLVLFSSPGLFSCPAPRRRWREAGLFHTGACWKSWIPPWLISFASFILWLLDDVQFSHVEAALNHQETFLRQRPVCLEFKTPPFLA